MFVGKAKCIVIEERRSLPKFIVFFIPRVEVLLPPNLFKSKIKKKLFMQLIVD
jgi:hypothetical protein